MEIEDWIWTSEAATAMISVLPEEQHRVLQSSWWEGDEFRFMFSGFGDTAINEKSNHERCKFIHFKIEEIVKDSKKAEILRLRK